jgi:xylose isomerase
VKETLTFKYYNADEVILGRKMRDWLRFSVVYWHTFRGITNTIHHMTHEYLGTGADPFGAPTLCRPWEDGTDSLANAERRMDVAFEFFTRLGVDYYTFHDR